MTGRVVEVILFDVMDTLVHDPFREALEAATGRPLRELFAARDPEAYPAFERGEIDEDAYWSHYEAAGFEVDVAAFHRVRRDGYAWIDGMPELLASLKGRVRRIGATNYPPWIEELTDGLLAGHLDDLVASYEVAARKPDADFYERVLARVGADVETTLFVDDREVNVEGARASGLDAVVFAGAARLTEELAGRGLASIGPT